MIGSIVFHTPVGAIGGAERALLDLAGSFRELPPPRPRVEVLVGRDGPIVGALAAIDVPVEVLALPPALASAGEASGVVGLVRAGVGVAAYGRRLAAAVRARRAEVVHSNGMKSHVLAALAVGGRFPVVWHVRDFPGLRRWAPRLLRMLARRTRGAVAISNAVARDLLDAGLDRVQVVHDGVDVERFSPRDGDGAALDRIAGAEPAPPGTVRVGLVATYAPWKGHRAFVDAAARIDRRLPLRFYVVGGPIYETPGSQVQEADLRAWIAGAGLGGRVLLVPFQPDAAPVYAALDVVVHASTAPEPFGLTVAEAMASGRAVIASSNAGVTELLAPGDDVVVVPPASPPALAAAIEALARDPARRATLAARARTTAVARLDRRRLASEMLGAYRALGL